MANEGMFGLLGQATELRQRILFTLGALIVYRLGTYIPVPGINALALSEIVENANNGVLGMFNMFSGGALGRMTIFALTILPYISATFLPLLLATFLGEYIDLNASKVALIMLCGLDVPIDFATTS